MRRSGKRGSGPTCSTLLCHGLQPAETQPKAKGNAQVGQARERHDLQQLDV